MWVVREGAERARRAAWRDRAARAGERIAEAFCALRGYEVVDRNVREGRGEIDLVVLDRGTVVFVEVKLRTGADSAAPLLAVTAKKREDVARAATRYLARRGLTDRPIRFDVVAITWEADGSKLRVEHIRNAFSGGGRHFF
jgi:putative endonuclease